jgi:hypothetical protein
MNSTCVQLLDMHTFDASSAKNDSRIMRDKLVDMLESSRSRVTFFLKRLRDCLALSKVGATNRGTWERDKCGVLVALLSCSVCIFMGSDLRLQSRETLRPTQISASLFFLGPRPPPLVASRPPRAHTWTFL